MAPEVTPTPVPDETAAAPTATSAPTPAPAAAPAVPDTGSAQDATLAKAQGYTRGMEGAQAQMAKDAAISTTPAPVPHARLLGMIQGLAVGLSAAGTAIGTGGKEGGAKEVAQIQGEQQQQKIQAQQAAQAAKNAKLQQDLQVFNTNMTLSENVRNLATLQNQMTESDLKVQEVKQAVTKGQLDIQSDAYQKFLGGQLSLSQYKTIIKQSGTDAGAAPAAGPGGIPSTAISNWEKPILDATTSAYKDDPGVKQAADDFAAAKAMAPKDADAAAQGMFQASMKAANIVDALQKGTASRLAASNADKAVSEAAGAKVKADQEQMAQNTYNHRVTKDANGQPTEDFATWQARETKAAETAVTQGDPTQMGAMAADGLLTIPQIALARQLDKKGFQDLLKGADEEAKRLGMPEVVVNGKPTGHYFNSNAATQQYQYVQEFNNPNSKIQQSIGSGNTFINHAADLSDLAKNYSTTNEKILNTPLNKVKDAFGSETFTRLNAAVQPVITEYQNALAAGFAPSAEDEDAAKTILSTSSTVGQINTATQQMAHTLLRRMESTDQGYVAHTGVHYPNMITPDAKTSLGKLGLDSGDMQSGGGFSGAPQTVNAGKTGGGAQAPHVIDIGGVQYIYNGSGDTADLKNYTKK